MGLNRLMIKSAAAEKNVLVMTLGRSSGGYIGYRGHGEKYGTLEGEFMHYGKAVTITELSYFNNAIYIRFKIDGITSGYCDVTIKMTEVDTGRAGRATLSAMYYSGNGLFIASDDGVPTELSRFFVIGNVGKKYTVEFIITGLG